MLFDISLLLKPSIGIIYYLQLWVLDLPYLFFHSRLSLQYHWPLAIHVATIFDPMLLCALLLQVLNLVSF